MKRIHLPLVLMLVSAVFGGLTAHTQGFAVKGIIRDLDTARFLAKASVRISSARDTTRSRFVSADDNGRFTIADLRNGDYILRFSFTGYQPSSKRLTIAGANIDLGEVLLVREDSTLSNVVVTGRVPPARQKGDTTEFNAAALKSNPDATTEDILRKAPGITVENGQVTAQGEQVRRITIDGRQYFGDDATAALRNLPAEMIDRIQVFDRLSDQAQLTGFDDGNSFKAINIVTKADMRKGQFGRLYAGYGTDDRYAAGGSVNIMKEKTRLNVIGLFNNVNQQNFGSEDLLGVSGAANAGRGGGGGGRGGGGFRPGGGNSNFQVGLQPGIATTNAIGLNFSDLWAGNKMEVSASYFYNDTRNEARSETRRETFLTGDTSQFYTEVRNNNSRNYNHRFTFRGEYKIDSFNTLILAPNISFQDNNSVTNLVGTNTSESGFLISSTINNNRSQAEGFNLNSEITYRHTFKAKRGRLFSVNLNNGVNNRESDVFLDAISGFIKTGTFVSDTLRQFTDNDNRSNSIRANITYSEPIGKKGATLQFNYSPQYTKSTADQRNFLYDETSKGYTQFDTTLSNVFENVTKAQSGGVDFRMGDRDKQLSFGINYQETLLESQRQFPQQGSLNKRFTNWLPNFQWRKNFNRQSNLRINYRPRLQTPSVNQLQDVINISNPLFVTTGNPNLDQSYNHFLFARYSYTNATKGKSFFAGIFTQIINDYITNGTWVASKDSTIAKDIVLRKGSQISKPINLDGFVNLRTFATYGFPIKWIKSNLNLTGGVTYGRTPGAVNGAINFSNSYTYNVGITVASNVSEYVDFNVSYNGNFNNVVNSISPELNNRFYFHSAGARLNLLTKKGWFVLNDITNQTYLGLADGFNQNFWLWNVSVGKKFLKNKRGELKASVFDLLKQNQSISRNIGETYIQDVQTQVLQQYFMFTFTYTLRNIGTAASRVGR